jgi:hypothetical protein
MLGTGGSVVVVMDKPGVSDIVIEKAVYQLMEERFPFRRLPAGQDC